ncbi:hypothetical protein [Aquabacter spiritensis]|uniref:Uncharacterized protein n=1 Tax=Aquabacter spiritensis TaxID=933073 RepID=A0A4V2UWP9_9HYPH|nr:hypothetical protein [Aquabacter spiritensis]TCT00548.1 hypothetical protein EDC64_12210 [Aquabacter spiritensis]
MRVAPLLTLAAALSFAVVGAAEAQTSSSNSQKKRTIIVITKRSPLDAGTVVKPGSKSYLDYALPANYFFPNYGAMDNGFVPGRYPLPDRFYLPGY